MCEQLLICVIAILLGGVVVPVILNLIFERKG